MAKLHQQTGPVTAAGKEISSGNATTHGGTSEKLIVPGERREDFDALLNDLVAEYSPETPDARNLVEDAALARWFLWRRQRAFNAVESALYAAQPAPENWPPEAFHKLALLDRYKTAAERSLKRILQNVASLHRAKKQEAQSKLALARATVALDRLARQPSGAWSTQSRNRQALAQALPGDHLGDREQWKAACNKFDCPTIVQKIMVRVRRGETITEMSPTNAELLHETQRAVHPPEQAYRYFEFPDGIPPEYYSFTDREDYRREKGHTIEQIGPLAAWLAVAAEERKLGTGHAVPGSSHFVS
jgi:hypothetical protein